MKRPPLHQWEQEMLDAYYDYQWHLVLDPLYEKFQEWKAGKISHSEMDKAIHETHQSSQNVCSLFTTKCDLLVQVIQFNEGWFSQWLKDHPQPAEQ